MPFRVLSLGERVGVRETLSRIQDSVTGVGR
jgi:hypothetical protein